MESKIVDRRNDLGLKLVYVILTAIITFLLSIVFFETYRKAEAAIVLGNSNKADIMVTQEVNKSINKNLENLNCKVDRLLGLKD
jgi:hypothetical protein